MVVGRSHLSIRYLICLVIIAINGIDGQAVLKVTSDGDLGGTVLVKYEAGATIGAVQAGGSCDLAFSNSGNGITADIKKGEKPDCGSIDLTVTVGDPLAELQVLTEKATIVLDGVTVNDGGKMKLQVRTSNDGLVEIKNSMIKQGGNNAKTDVNMEGGNLNITSTTFDGPLHINVPQINVYLVKTTLKNDFQLHTKTGENVISIDQDSAVDGLYVKGNPGSKVVAIMYGLGKNVRLHVDDIDIYLKGKVDLSSLDFKVKGNVNFFLELPEGSTVDNNLTGGVTLEVANGQTVTVMSASDGVETMATNVMLTGSGATGKITTGTDLGSLHNINLNGNSGSGAWSNVGSLSLLSSVCWMSFYYLLM